MGRPIKVTYTVEEIDFIKKNYKKIPLTQICNELWKISGIERARTSVQNKAFLLGLASKQIKDFCLKKDDRPPNFSSDDVDGRLNYYLMWSVRHGNQ